MQIAIFGRKENTSRYESFLEKHSVSPLVTLSIGALSSCSGLILPGGGDITPAFFGQKNTCSNHVDTELDILQLQALDFAIRHELPVLGICKGMQVINVAFGGTILQNLPTSFFHTSSLGDCYHDTIIKEGSVLFSLYGSTACVNSAHHQGIAKLGKNLEIIQWCPFDQCVEAISHKTLPILGVQWHPERLLGDKTELTATPLLNLWLSWICK